LTSFLSDKLDLEPKKPRLALLPQNLKLRSLNIQNVKSDQQEFPKILKSFQQPEEIQRAIRAYIYVRALIMKGAARTLILIG